MRHGEIKEKNIGLQFPDHLHCLRAIASLGVPLIVGPMAAALGLPSTGLLAMALMVAPIGLLLALREPSPGLYAPVPASGDAS